MYAQLSHAHYSEMLQLAYGRDISSIQPADAAAVDRVVSEQNVAQQLYTYDIPKTFDDT